MTLILRAEIIIGNRIGECINNFKCPFIKKKKYHRQREEYLKRNGSLGERKGDCPPYRKSFYK